MVRVIAQMIVEAHAANMKRPAPSLYLRDACRLRGVQPASRIRNRHMMRPLSIAASLALVLAATAVTAQNATTPPASDPAATTAAPAAEMAPTAAPAVALTGDATRGKGLTYTCRGCHGVEGYKNAYPSYHVPKLGGQSEVYLRNALMEYRSAKRKHPTMQAQAESFSEQDIADIAAYLSSIK
jgi:cytochrome c553